MRHLSSDGLAAFLLLHPRTKVLDVRLDYERHARQLPGSFHVPWSSHDLETRTNFLGRVLQHISPQDYVLVVCHNGHLSCEVAMLLERTGFLNVYVLIGGYREVRETGYMDIIADSLLMHYQPT
jgi:rhodanese-related sulfurtransferase